MKKFILPLWIGTAVLLLGFASYNPSGTPSVSDASMVALIAGWILVYWLPTVIAMVRGTATGVWVGVINLLLGWTGIGWIVALVLSLLGRRSD